VPVLEDIFLLIASILEILAFPPVPIVVSDTVKIEKMAGGPEGQLFRHKGPCRSGPFVFFVYLMPILT
jgi:hypothetical protein